MDARAQNAKIIEELKRKAEQAISEIKEMERARSKELASRHLDKESKEQIQRIIKRSTEVKEAKIKEGLEKLQPYLQYNEVMSVFTRKAFEGQLRGFTEESKKPKEYIDDQIKELKPAKSKQSDEIAAKEAYYLEAKKEIKQMMLRREEVLGEYKKLGLDSKIFRAISEDIKNSDIYNEKKRQLKKARNDPTVNLETFKKEAARLIGREPEVYMKAKIAGAASKDENRKISLNLLGIVGAYERQKKEKITALVKTAKDAIAEIKSQTLAALMKHPHLDQEIASQIQRDMEADIARKEQELKRVKDELSKESKEDSGIDVNLAQFKTWVGKITEQQKTVDPEIEIKKRLRNKIDRMINEAKAAATEMGEQRTKILAEYKGAGLPEKVHGHILGQIEGSVTDKISKLENLRISTATKNIEKLPRDIKDLETFIKDMQDKSTTEDAEKVIQQIIQTTLAERSIATPTLSALTNTYNKNKKEKEIYDLTERGNSILEGAKLKARTYLSSTGTPDIVSAFILKDIETQISQSAEELETLISAVQSAQEQQYTEAVQALTKFERTQKEEFNEEKMLQFIERRKEDPETYRQALMANYQEAIGLYKEISSLNQSLDVSNKSLNLYVRKLEEDLLKMQPDATLDEFKPNDLDYLKFELVSKENILMEYDLTGGTRVYNMSSEETLQDKVKRERLAKLSLILEADFKSDKAIGFSDELSESIQSLKRVKKAREAATTFHLFPSSPSEVSEKDKIVSTSPSLSTKKPGT